MAPWNGEKYLDNFGVELSAGTAPNFLEPLKHWKAIATRPVAQHGIEGVGDGDDACPAPRGIWHLRLPDVKRASEYPRDGMDSSSATH